MITGDGLLFSATLYTFAVHRLRNLSVACRNVVIAKTSLPLPRNYHVVFTVPRYYREIFPVPAIVTVVTAVLPLSPLPCHRLVSTTRCVRAARSLPSSRGIPVNYWVMDQGRSMWELSQSQILSWWCLWCVITQTRSIEQDMLMRFVILIGYNEDSQSHS